MLLLLLAIVFASVFIAFNLFINIYIRSSVEMQLDGLVKGFGMSPPGPAAPPEGSPAGPEGGFQVPDLSGQQRNRIGARGEVIILDASYNVITFDQFRANENSEELNQIAGSLKERAVSLAQARNVKVDTSEGEYYISSVEDARMSGNFLVFYVSVAGINHLVDTVNTAMAVIMAAAMMICFITANIIAGSVTKPLKKLSDFAGALGRGDFKRTEFTFMDIEFDELGEAMNESAEKLDLYDKEQKTFFQNVSHELRTPLQSIRANGEGAMYGLMDAKKSGATIVAETDRLTELVEDLLYISRVDSLTGAVEKRENDLRETLALCAENQKTIAENRGIRFVYEFDDDPVLYSYNEKHMYRAFSNLISNALRYASKAVTLRCYRSDGVIKISVADDGPGVSDTDLPHLFERFYKGKGGKHGIGLSIVKSAVLHGGTVTVVSDKGACFTIEFIA